MSIKHLISLTTLVLVVSLLPAAGLAQDKDPAAELERAEKLALEGRVAEAMTVWEAVLPQVGGQMAAGLHARLGLGYRKFGKLPEAWHHLNLHVNGTGKPDPEAAENLAQLNKALPRSWGQVQITTTPPGARVYLGKEAAGTSYETPLTWWFKPGRHDVTVTMATYRTDIVTVEVAAAGSNQVAAFTLSKDERDGVLQVKGSEVGAQVFINGLLEGTIPFYRKMKPGTYDLMVGRPGLPVWKKKVVVEAGQDVIERPKLKGDDEGGALAGGPDDNGMETLPEKPTEETPKRKPPAIWKWALAGGGLALVGIGGGLNAAAISRNDELKKLYPDGTYWERAPSQNPVKYKDGYDNEVVPMATTAYVLYGVGAAAAIAGTIFLFIPEEVEGKATVAPMVAPDTAGISFTLDF